MNALLLFNPTALALQVKKVMNGILPKKTVISYARIRVPPLNLYNPYYDSTYISFLLLQTSIGV